MTWNTWKPALALGAMLAASGATRADDTPPTSTTMTLGGKGTPAQAATEDTELARGYRGGYHGGHYGWGGGYGGYGYRGGYSYYRPAYYGGGYGGYYGGYYGGFYRPAYYYTPRVYFSNYYYPTYPVYSTYSSGFFIGIGGNSLALGAPVVPLGTSLAPPAAQPMSVPTVPGDGTFRYDGGPANPVPLPKAEPQAIPPANSSATTDLPVSLKSKPVTPSPYKYKAYGEK